MGFLDKLLGRGKQMASGVAEKAGDVAEAGLGAAEQAAHKGTEVAGDVIDRVRDKDGEPPASSGDGGGAG